MAQNSTPDELTPKQQRLLSEMLTGKSVEQAATASGVALRTAYRWRALPLFKQKLIAAQQELFEEHLAMLKTGVRSALVTLSRNMADSKHVPPSVQVSSARAWLENAIQVYKIGQVEEEVQQLRHLLSQDDAWRQ